MLRSLVVVLLAACLLASVANAKPDPRDTSLQAQVAQLQRQVKTLTAALVAETNHRVCDYALTQDQFRTAFTAMSKITQAITGMNVPAWEQIPRFDDAGACAAVGVTRP